MTTFSRYLIGITVQLVASLPAAPPQTAVSSDTTTLLEAEAGTLAVIDDSHVDDDGVWLLLRFPAGPQPGAWTLAPVTTVTETRPTLVSAECAVQILTRELHRAAERFWGRYQARRRAAARFGTAGSGHATATSDTVTARSELDRRDEELFRVHHAWWACWMAAREARTTHTRLWVACHHAELDAVHVLFAHTAEVLDGGGGHTVASLVADGTAAACDHVGLPEVAHWWVTRETSFRIARTLGFAGCDRDDTRITDLLDGLGHQPRAFQMSVLHQAAATLPSSTGTT